MSITGTPAGRILSGPGLPDKCKPEDADIFVKVNSAEGVSLHISDSSNHWKELGSVADTPLALSALFDKRSTIVGSTLVLSDWPITTLPAGSFNGMSFLTILRLHDNNLSSLPSKIFDQLTNLTDLDLYANNLSTLPAGVFDHNIALASLDIGANPLITLPAGIFSHNTALTNLYLYSDQLTSVPNISNLVNLVILDLDTNALTTLPSGFLDNQVALRGLNLHDNLFTSFPAGLLANNINLINFSARNLTLLTTLPPSFFDTNINLSFIDFSNCALDEPSIGNILISLVTAGNSGGSIYFDTGSNAAHPTWTAPTLAAETTLLGRGWTVTSN